MSAAIVPRRSSQVPFESALEVSLVSETGCHRHVSKTVSLPKPLAAELDTSVDQVGMGRQAIVILERPDEIGRRQFRRGGDVIQGQRFSAVLTDKVGGSLKVYMGYFWSFSGARRKRSLQLEKKVEGCAVLVKPVVTW